MPERRFGRFVLRRQLGAGGMGEVWEAEPIAGGAPVALKWVHSATSAGRFREEMRVSGSLDHPNLVKVLDSGTEGGRAWMAMELLDGASLADLRRAHPEPWPEPVVIELGRQLLGALEALHTSAGIVHRDLKPSNLFIRRDGRLCVIDLGIALATDRDRTQTQSGSMVGTLRYASPEQARGERVDARSDLFAVGLVLFELVSGQRAYDQRDDVAVVSALLFEPPPRLSAVHPLTSPALDEVIAGALQRDPNARFPTAAAFSQALDSAGTGRPWRAADVAAWAAPLFEACLASKPTETTAPGELVTRSADRRPVTARRSWQRRMVVIGAGVAVAAALAGAMISRSSEVPPIVARPASALGTAPAAPPAPSSPAKSEALVPPRGEGSAPPASPLAAAAEATAAPETSQGGSRTAPAKKERARGRARTRPAQGTGWVTVAAKGGWARVLIDRKDVGETPLFRHPLPAGTHQVETVTRAGLRQRRRVTVVPGREAKLVFVLD